MSLSKKTICIVALEHRDYVCVGGLGTFIKNIADELSLRDWNVHVFVLQEIVPRINDVCYEEYDADAHGKRVHVTHYLTAAGVHIHSIDAYGNGVASKEVLNHYQIPADLSNLIAAVYTLSTILGRPQWRNALIVTNDDQTAMLSMLLRMNAPHNNQFLYHIVHNFDESYRLPFTEETLLTICMVAGLDESRMTMALGSGNNGASGGGGGGARSMTEMSLPFTDGWCSVSPTYLQSLLDTHLAHLDTSTRQRGVGICNGIRPMLETDKLDTRRELKKALLERLFEGQGPNQDQDAAIVYTFVGRITYQKGVAELLRGIELFLTQSRKSMPASVIDRVRFLVVGNTNEHEHGYTAECEETAARLTTQFPTNVFCRFGSFYNAEALFQVSDFGLVPSVFEPCGIVQQEFFACGVPVIARDVGGLHDTIRDFRKNRSTGNGFLFERYTDLYELLRTSTYIYANEYELYRRLEANARTSFITVAEMVDEYMNAFQNLPLAYKHQTRLEKKSLAKQRVHGVSSSSSSSDSNTAISNIMNQLQTTAVKHTQ